MDIDYNISTNNGYIYYKGTNMGYQSTWMDLQIQCGIDIEKTIKKVYYDRIIENRDSKIDYILNNI